MRTLLKELYAISAEEKLTTMTRLGQRRFTCFRRRREQQLDRNLGGWLGVIHCDEPGRQTA